MGFPEDLIDILMSFDTAEKIFLHLQIINLNMFIDKV